MYKNLPPQMYGNVILDLDPKMKKIPHSLQDIKLMDKILHQLRLIDLIVYRNYLQGFLYKSQVVIAGFLVAINSMYSIPIEVN